MRRVMVAAVDGGGRRGSSCRAAVMLLLLLLFHGGRGRGDRFDRPVIIVGCSDRTAVADRRPAAVEVVMVMVVRLRGRRCRLRGRRRRRRRRQRSRLMVMMMVLMMMAGRPDRRPDGPLYVALVVGRGVLFAAALVLGYGVQKFEIVVC